MASIQYVSTRCHDTMSQYQSQVSVQDVMIGHRQKLPFIVPVMSAETNDLYIGKHDIELSHLAI